MHLRRYESFCCYLTGLFPKLLTSGLYFYGIYAYSIVCLQLIGGLDGLILLFLGVTLFFDGIYTYFRVIQAGPGSPLEFPELKTDAPPEQLANNSILKKQNGRFRYCSKCEVWKPDRTHHCSNCKICHLKMDHHCPWFASCIGFNNHKFFVQFLLITVAYTSLILLVSGVRIYKFFKEEEFEDAFINLNLLIVCILSLAVSVSTCIFTGLTLYFLLNNITTIENFDRVRTSRDAMILSDSIYGFSKPKIKHPYDLGWKKNWKVVMGNGWKEWILPITNIKTGDFYENNGLTFNINPEILESLKSIGPLQQRLQQQLYDRTMV